MFLGKTFIFGNTTTFSTSKKSAVVDRFVGKAEQVVFVVRLSYILFVYNTGLSIVHLFLARYFLLNHNSLVLRSFSIANFVNNLTILETSAFDSFKLFLRNRLTLSLSGINSNKFLSFDSIQIVCGNKLSVRDICVLLLNKNIVTRVLISFVSSLRYCLLTWEVFVTSGA